MAEILLIRAAQQGKLEETGQTVLINAAFYGHFDIVSLLIESSAQINHQDVTGWAALHFASITNHISIVSLLIEKGADDGFTSLMRSARYGYFSIVSLLLQSGADVSLRNNYGKTALDWARMKNTSDCVAIIKNYEHFHRYRKVWLSFSTSMRSFQEDQNQESKQIQSQIQSQSPCPSLMKVVDSSDLVRYVTEYM